MVASVVAGTSNDRKPAGNHCPTRCSQKRIIMRLPSAVQYTQKDKNATQVVVSQGPSYSEQVYEFFSSELSYIGDCKIIIGRRASGELGRELIKWLHCLPGQALQKTSAAVCMNASAVTVDRPP